MSKRSREIEALELKIKNLKEIDKHPLFFELDGIPIRTTIGKVEDLISDALLKKQKFTLRSEPKQFKCACCKLRKEYLWRADGLGGSPFDKTMIFCKKCLSNNTKCSVKPIQDTGKIYYPAVMNPTLGTFYDVGELSDCPGFNQKKWEEENK
jgi:Zn finger protein HypA/HybF involved in hydrogenase expression